MGTNHGQKGLAVGQQALDRLELDLLGRLVLDPQDRLVLDPLDQLVFAMNHSRIRTLRFGDSHLKNPSHR